MCKPVFKQIESHCSNSVNKNGQKGKSPLSPALSRLSPFLLWSFFSPPTEKWNNKPLSPPTATKIPFLHFHSSGGSFFFLPFVSFVLLKNYIQNKNSCRKFFLSRVTHAGDSVRSSLLGFLVNSLIASNYRQQPRERVNEITSRMFHYFTLKRV